MFSRCCYFLLPLRCSYATPFITLIVFTLILFRCLFHAASPLRLLSMLFSFSVSPCHAAAAMLLFRYVLLRFFCRAAFTPYA